MHEIEIPPLWVSTAFFAVFPPKTMFASALSLDRRLCGFNTLTLKGETSNGPTVVSYRKGRVEGSFQTSNGDAVRPSRSTRGESTGKPFPMGTYVSGQHRGV